MEELQSPVSLCRQWAVKFLFGCRCIDTHQSKYGSGILEGVEGIIGLLIKQGDSSKGRSSALLWENQMNAAMIPSTAMAIAIEHDETSAASTANCSALLATCLPSLQEGMETCSILQRKLFRKVLQFTIIKEVIFGQQGLVLQFEIQNWRLAEEKTLHLRRSKLLPSSSVKVKHRCCCRDHSVAACISSLTPWD